MKALNGIIEEAKNSAKKRIVLPEGYALRVIKAAVLLKQDDVAAPILLGNKKSIQSKAKDHDIDLSDIEIINPVESEWSNELTELLFELRKHKGMSIEQAEDRVQDALWFANLMVKAGYADGCVSGSVYTTGDVVRTALQTIGVKAVSYTHLTLPTIYSV